MLQLLPNGHARMCKSYDFGNIQFKHLFVFLQLVPVEVGGNGPVLRRQKREWFMAPRRLHENQDYTGQNIARVCNFSTYSKVAFS